MNPQAQISIAASAPLSESNPAASALDRASDPALTEDLALALLKAPDLSSDAVAVITQNASLNKSRKVRLAVAAHPRAPRRIALRLIRELYTFDLMQFALLPSAAAHLKH